MAIGTDGEITFCNTQMKRLLMRRSSRIIGANIEDFIISSSKESIRKMIQDILAFEQQVSHLGNGAESDSSSESSASILSMPLNPSGSKQSSMDSSQSRSSSSNSCSIKTHKVSWDGTATKVFSPSTLTNSDEKTSSFPQEGNL